MNRSTGSLRGAGGSFSLAVRGFIWPCNSHRGYTFQEYPAIRSRNMTMPCDDLPQEGDLMLFVALGRRASKYWGKSASSDVLSTVVRGNTLAGTGKPLRVRPQITNSPDGKPIFNFPAISASKTPPPFGTHVAASKPALGVSGESKAPPVGGAQVSSDQGSDLATPPGFVERNWPYLLGGAGVAGLGYLASQRFSKKRDEDQEKQADVAYDQAVAGADQISNWMNNNPERTNQIAGTIGGGMLAIPAAMALRGGYSLARAPYGYGLQSAARGAGIGAGAALGGALGGLAHDVTGTPTDLATALAARGVGALAGGYGVSRLLGDHPAEKDKDVKRAADGPLSQAGNYLQNEVVNPVVGWGNQNIVNPAADQFSKQVKSNFGMGEGGPGGFMDRNPWAYAPIIGGGIGAGIGAIGALGGKKKKNVLGSILQGGLLGAGAGGLAWGAKELWDGPKSPPPPPPPPADRPPADVIKPPPAFPGAPEQVNNLKMLSTTPGREAARVMDGNNTHNAASHLLWANNPEYGTRLGDPAMLDAVRQRAETAAAIPTGTGSGPAMKGLHEATTQAYESLAKNPERPLFSDPSKATAAQAAMGLPITLGKSEAWKNLENAPSGTLDEHLAKLQGAKGREFNDVTGESSYLMSPAARSFYEGTAIGVGGRQLAARGLRGILGNDTTGRDAAQLSKLLSGTPPQPAVGPNWIGRKVRAVGSGINGTFGNLMPSKAAPLTDPTQAVGRSTLMDRLTAAVNAQKGNSTVDRADVGKLLSGQGVKGVDKGHLASAAASIAQGKGGVADLAQNPSMVTKLNMTMTNSGYKFKSQLPAEQMAEVRAMLTGAQKPDPTLLKALQTYAPGQTYQAPGLLGRATGSQGRFTPPKSSIPPPTSGRITRLTGSLWRGTPYGLAASLYQHAGRNPTAETPLESLSGLGAGGLDLSDPVTRNRLSTGLGQSVPMPGAQAWDAAGEGLGKARDALKETFPAATPAQPEPPITASELRNAELTISQPGRTEPIPQPIFSENEWVAKNRTDPNNPAGDEALRQLFRKQVREGKILPKP